MRPKTPRTAATWGVSVPVLERAQAVAARMKPVTYAYKHSEAVLMQSAVRQLNGIPCAVVPHKQGMELWRK